MPRDVVTRWNSTYDMLAFALEYRKPIEMLSADWELDLRKYELNPQEWKLATQLKDVLQVSNFVYAHSFVLTCPTLHRYLNMLLFSFRGLKT